MQSHFSSIMPEQLIELSLVEIEDDIALIGVNQWTFEMSLGPDVCISALESNKLPWFMSTSLHVESFGIGMKNCS